MKRNPCASVCVWSIIVMLTAGCARFADHSGQPYPIPEQERNFAGALESLRSGNQKLARELLERVVVAPPLGGVTDEALFRLALLMLPGETGKGTARAQELLERLKNEYPQGLWTTQSAPLAMFLKENSTLRSQERELKNLRLSNSTLTRENRELRQSIERLKNLDIELEKR